LAVKGKIEQALQLAQDIKDESFKALLLRSIAQLLAESGDFDQAIQVTQTLKNKYYQASTLAAIAHELTSIGQTERASRTLNQALEIVASN
jgi:predicted negative regulator of RcsB-dependent stress response